MTTALIFAAVLLLGSLLSGIASRAAISNGS